MISNQTFFIIYDSFVNGLRLSGLQMNVYALLYSFCTQGQGSFSGSIPYLARRTGASVNGVRKALSSLTNKGLIEKYRNDNGFPSYRIVESANPLHSVDAYGTQSIASGELSGINKKDINIKARKSVYDNKSSKGRGSVFSTDGASFNLSQFEGKSMFDD